MKKSIPIIRERESEASILGNGREREFPLTPVVLLAVFYQQDCHICTFSMIAAGSTGRPSFLYQRD